MSASGGRRFDASKNNPRVKARFGILTPFPPGKGPKAILRQPRFTEAVLPVNGTPHRDTVNVPSLRCTLENIKQF